jgi:hypothetical protein
MENRPVALKCRDNDNHRSRSLTWTRCVNMRQVSVLLVFRPMFRAWQSPRQRRSASDYPSSEIALTGGSNVLQGLSIRPPSPGYHRTYWTGVVRGHRWHLSLACCVRYPSVRRDRHCEAARSSNQPNPLSTSILSDGYNDPPGNTLCGLAN